MKKKQNPAPGKPLVHSFPGGAIIRPTLALICLLLYLFVGWVVHTLLQHVNKDTFHIWHLGALFEEALVGAAQAPFQPPVQRRCSRMHRKHGRLHQELLHSGETRALGALPGVVRDLEDSCQAYSLFSGSVGR